MSALNVTMNAMHKSQDLYPAYLQSYLQVIFAQWSGMFLKLVHVNIQYSCNKIPWYRCTRR